MKKHLLKLIVTIVGFFMLSSFVCPNNDETKRYPHESDCSKFYVCSDGMVIVQTCPRGLHFDANMEVCDYPENVDCDVTSAAPADCKVGNTCYYNTTFGVVDACICEGDPTKGRVCELQWLTQVNMEYKTICETRKSQ